MQKPFQHLIVVSFLLGALMLGGCDSPKREQAATPTTSPSTATTSPDTTTNQFPGLPRLNGKATVLMTVKGNKQITIELDGNYAVFGKITQGLDIIDTIQQGDKITSAKVTQGIENLKK